MVDILDPEIRDVIADLRHLIHKQAESDGEDRRVLYVLAIRELLEHDN